MPSLARVVIFTVVLVSGCVGTPQDDPVLGRWEVTGADAEIEFLPDGTAEVSESAGARQERWERLADGHIVLETITFTGNDATPQSLRIDILEGGREAVVTFSNGETARMRRVDQP